ncbi:MAG TPA: sterol desaturase family protein [Cyclobacteriaceae bacterium]|nr:sterol desaturase family protein [Cyclobacteriaceae bacterium]
MNPTALVIPAFFLFFGLEYFVARRRGKGYLFNYENTVANLSIGIAERLLNLFITGSFYGLYYYIYEHYALVEIPNQWWVWVLLLLATDLVWYWYHRLGHEINVLWGAHIVHHHSEDFNYTVSARITTLQSIVRNMFWCVLPLVGFNPGMVIAILVVHGAYSFFTHTQVIGNLGWLEHILITPTHHGVHHASNPKYLNKNYGDIFIFWDKLFGTFQREEEKPVYGLTHPLKSHSFLWQHFHYYMELWVACRRAKGFMGAMRVLLGRPEAIDQNIRPALERKLLPGKKYSRHTSRFKAYLNTQLIACLAVLFLFTLLYPAFNLTETTFVLAMILITLVICGAMLEQRQWVYYLELVRCLVVVAYVSVISESGMLFAIGFIFLLLISPGIDEGAYYKWVYGRANTRE